MAHPVPVEQVEKGDRAVVWFQGASAPVTATIGKIVESSSCRNLHCDYEGGSFEVAVPHGHTVDLAC